MPYCPIQLLKLDAKIQDRLMKEDEKNGVVREKPFNYHQGKSETLKYYEETGILMLG